MFQLNKKPGVSKLSLCNFFISMTKDLSIFTNCYQNNCRVYLDEYEGQENTLEFYKEIRLKRDRKIAKIFGEPFNSMKEPLDVFKLFLEICLFHAQEHPEKLHNLDDCWSEFDNITEKSDIYFERRWLRRN